MKPFDGGGLARGVSKVRNQAELMAAYDDPARCWTSAEVY